MKKLTRFAAKSLEVLTAVLAISLVVAVSGFSPERVRSPKVPAVVSFTRN